MSTAQRKAVGVLNEDTCVLEQSKFLLIRLNLPLLVRCIMTSYAFNVVSQNANNSLSELELKMAFLSISSF